MITIYIREIIKSMIVACNTSLHCDHGSDYSITTILWYMYMYMHVHVHVHVHVHIHDFE